jgi:transposase-like protein
VNCSGISRKFVNCSPGGHNEGRSGYVGFSKESRADADVQQQTGCDMRLPSSGRLEIVASMVHGLSGRTGQSERIVALCEGDGATTADICRATGGRPNTISAAVAVLVQQGRLVRTGGWPSRYIATGVPSPKRPKLSDEELQRRRRERKKLENERAKARNAAAKAALTSGAKPVTLGVTHEKPKPAANYAGVKVTVCPHGIDYRFTADPSIAGRGVITQDWKNRRLMEAQRG